MQEGYAPSPSLALTISAFRLVSYRVPAGFNVGTNSLPALSDPPCGYMVLAATGSS